MGAGPEWRKSMNAHGYPSNRLEAAAARLRWAVVGAVLAVSLAPATALAAEVRAANTVAVASGQTIDDDLYAFGATVDIQGTVNGDVIAAAQTTNISGIVNGNVIAAGSNVNITGAVRGSVRVAGSDVDVSAPVGRDLLAAGGTVNVTPGGSVGGDALLGAGTVTLGAPVARNVLMSVGQLTIQAPIAGNVTGNAGQIHVASGGRIGGNLSFTGQNDATLDPGATVAGAVSRTAPPRQQPRSESFTLVGAAVAWLRTVVGLFAVGLLFVLLWPAFTSTAAAKLVHSAWASLGIGAAVVLFAPIAGTILLVTGIFVGGWYLALFAMALYAMAAVAGYAVSGYVAGHEAFERLAANRVHRVWQLLAGVVVLTLLSHIPFVGWLITAAAIVFGFGAILIAVGSGFRGPEATTRPVPLSLAA
jgi:cytoskeletal protein CcmA (bactofilin family)